MISYLGVFCYLGFEMAYAWMQYDRIENGKENYDMKSHDYYHIHGRMNVKNADDAKGVLYIYFYLMYLNSIAHIVYMIVIFIIFMISFKVAIYGKFVLKDYNIAPERSMDIYEEGESYTNLMREIEKFILLFIIIDIGFPILNFSYNLMMEDTIAGFFIVFAIFHLIYFFNVTPESMKKNEAVGYFLSFLLMCGVGIAYLACFIYFLVRTIQYIIINQNNLTDDNLQFYHDRYFPLYWENPNDDQSKCDFRIDYNISLFSYITYGCTMIVFLFAAGYSILMVKDGWRLFVNRDSVNVEMMPKMTNTSTINKDDSNNNSFYHSLKNIKIEMIITLVFDLFYFIYCFTYKDFDEVDLGIIYVVIFIIDVIYLIIIFTKYTEQPVYLLFYYLSIICSCGRLITMFYSMKLMRNFTDIYLYANVTEARTVAILTGVLIIVFIIIAFINWRSIISGLCLWQMTKDHPHGGLLGIFSYLLSLCKRTNNNNNNISKKDNVLSISEVQPIEVELPNVVPVHPNMNENDTTNQPIGNYVKITPQNIEAQKIETKVEPKIEPIQSNNDGVVSNSSGDESKDDSVVVVDNDDDEDIPDQLDLPPELQ